MTDKGTVSQAKATSTISLPRLLFNETFSVNFSRYEIMILALYKETKFFRLLSSGFTNFSQRVNSYVIAGSIKGHTFLNLTNPVVLRFSTLKSADKGSTLCGFWDFSQASWSRAGCAFQGVLNDGRIVCHCNHLTNFAMLMVSWLLGTALELILISCCPIIIDARSLNECTKTRSMYFEFPRCVSLMLNLRNVHCMLT